MGRFNYHLLLLLLLVVQGAFGESTARFREYFSQFQAKSYSNDFSPTVGQEIEMIMSGNFNRVAVANRVKALLEQEEKISNVSVTTGDRNSAEVHYYSSSGKHRTIGLKPDFSVDRTMSLELVSPVIASQNEYERFLRVANEVNRTQPTIPVTKAGLHTHVGFKDAQEAEIAVLTTLWGGIESKMRQLYSVHPDRVRWAKSLPASQTDVNRSVVSTVFNELGTTHDMHNMNSPKYRSLNLLPLRDRGTVEFRFANATLDPLQLEVTSDFFRHLVRAIRTKKPELVEYLTTTDLADIDVRELAKRIGADIFYEKYEELGRATRAANPTVVAAPASPTRPRAVNASHTTTCASCGYPIYHSVEVTGEHAYVYENHRGQERDRVTTTADTIAAMQSEGRQITCRAVYQRMGHY